eukprot:COSAG02_NODE_63008_length_264_cov_0.757576_1_plen_69_part_01
MHQQPAVPSQEEGVPPAAATAAREAQQQGRAVQEPPPVPEQTTFESLPPSLELATRAAAARAAPRWVPD